VTIAVVLLGVYAVVAGVPPILSLLFGPDLASVIARGAPTFGGAVSEGETAMVAGVTVALSLAIMIGFGSLAFRVSRGGSGARIATWVFGGVFTLCNVASLQSVVALLGQDERPGVPSAEQLGVHPWDLAIAAVELLSLAVALVLLALPSAGAFFRRMDTWVPPVGYVGPAPSPIPDVWRPRAEREGTNTAEPTDPAP